MSLTASQQAYLVDILVPDFKRKAHTPSTEQELEDTVDDCVEALVGEPLPRKTWLPVVKKIKRELGWSRR